MKCEECLLLLEVYADGELDAWQGARVGAHTEDCAACARALKELEEEQQLFLAYECDAEAADGFWDEVLSKVAAEADARPATAPSPSPVRWRDRLAAAFGHFSAPRLSPALTAALLLVAVGATVAIMKYDSAEELNQLSHEIKRADDLAAPSTPFPAPSGVPDSALNSSSKQNANAPDETGQTDEKAAGVAENHDIKAGQPVREFARRNDAANVTGRKKVNIVAAGDELHAARRIPAAQPAESASDKLVREAEQKYQAAISLLARDVSRQRERLDPDTRARFEQTLAAVDRTIADTRRAARQHPRDPVAVQYMLTAYAKKVEVLREMSRY